MKLIFRHPKKLVAAVVSVVLAVWLQSQGLPAPMAQALGAKVGEAAGEAAQDAADRAAQ